MANLIKENFIGRIYESNNFGKFKIIEYVGKDNNDNDLFKIQFKDTGYINIVSYVAIRHGAVRDKMKPVIAGIGYVGNLDKPISSPELFQFYKPWNDMMNRCYNKNDKDYPGYGAIGISVDPRWHCFANYYEDIQHIPNFELKLKYPKEYQIDKDYLQRNIPKSQRVYSKDTCIWLSKHDNVSLMSDRYDNEYHGVLYRDGGYNVRYQNKQYGKYPDLITAANVYNYVYTLFNINNPFIQVPYINENIPYVSPQDAFQKLINPKLMCKIVQQ